MNRPIISRQAKFAVLFMFAVAGTSYTQAAEPSQSYLAVRPTYPPTWVRIGALPKPIDPGIFKRNLLGPVFRYIEDPINRKHKLSTPRVDYVLHSR
jgi:hypothetical protein